MSEILPFVIVGLVSGSLYGLAGLGLIVTYRTSGILNFAHGAVAAAGAFVFYTLREEHGVPWPIAGLLTLAAFAVVGGFLLERITRTAAGASPVALVVLTVGLLLSIQGVLFLQYGDLTRNFAAFLPTSTSFTVAGVQVSWDQVISIAVALVCGVGLFAFLKFTRRGLAMRAVVDNPSLLTLTGTEPTKVSLASWAVGTSFAALSGILLAPTIGLDAVLLTMLVVQSFGACAIGLFKSLPLTYAGGLIVGVAASVSTKYFTTRPWTGLPAAVPFIIVICVLVAVPSRSLPRVGTTVRSLGLQSSRRSTRSAVATGAISAVALAIIPFVVGSDLSLFSNGLIYVIIFGSLGLLLWTSGQISLCHLAFVAIGATTLGHVTAWGVPWLPALLIAGLATVPIGALVAIPAIRLSGIYLAVVTLGFGVLMQYVAYQSNLMFGAQQAVKASRPQLGFIDGTNDRWFYFIVLSVAVVSCIVLLAIQRGQLGRFLRAMSENPTTLTTSGLQLSMTKLIVFCISAFFAGIAGGLSITQFSAVTGDSLGPIQSMLLIAVLGIAGTRLFRSSVMAAVAVTVAPGYLIWLDSDKQLLLFGISATAAGLLLANRDRLTKWFERSSAASANRLVHSPVTDRLIRSTVHEPARRIDDFDGRRDHVLVGSR